MRIEAVRVQTDTCTKHSNNSQCSSKRLSSHHAQAMQNQDSSGNSCHIKPGCQWSLRRNEPSDIGLFVGFEEGDSVGRNVGYFVGSNDLVGDKVGLRVG